jgi:hypothetical protein
MMHQRQQNVPGCRLHRRPCFNCGENNQSQNQCRNNARVECYQYLTSVEDLQFVTKLTEIQLMQSKGSFSQFERNVFKSKLNGLIEVASSSPFS